MAQAPRVQVPPERLARWLAGFAERHGPPVVTPSSDRVELRSPDGAVAGIALHWGPLPGEDDPLAELVAAATRPRRLGALLLRKSAHAVGVFDGEALVAHSIGRAYVQGRTKAGGWSQQRYARRRDNQAARAYAKAADKAAELLLPEAGRLDGLILGGDAAAVAAVLALPDLSPLKALADRTGRRPLPVPDPNLKVLRQAWHDFVAVSIELNAAARGGSTPAQHDHQPGQ